ncbi:P-loop containing nucleoside triphosphate hydrolase protein [Mucidula mucida]|nr:P-loop containing nucleoside triphosphate hydrolase protein [Mucidula mucida]
MPVGWCYDSVAPGGCSLPSGTCALLHNISKCSCGLILDTGNLAGHLRGRRHQQIMKGTVPVQSKRAGPRAEPVSVATLSCPQCRRDFPENAFDAHLQTHSVQEQIAATLSIAQQDKNGISVSAPRGVDFGIVDESSAPRRVIVVITRTDGSETPIYLLKCRLASSFRKGQYDTQFSITLAPGPKFLRTGRSRTVSILFKPSYAGQFEDTLELEFFDQEKRRRFIIHRPISATVGDLADHEELRPVSAYTPRKRRNIRLDGPINRSLRPPSWTPTKWVSRLPMFDIPNALIRTIYTKEGYLKSSARQDVRNFMPASFTASTYGAYFQTMIYLEEEQMRQDLDAYSMTDVEIKADYPRYNIDVAGLSEGRPSVNVGDFIRVRAVEHTNNTWYEGCVHKVAEKHVSVRFSDEFNTYKKAKFEVRFVLNRLSFRRMHQALVNKNNPTRLLFPDVEHLTNARRMSADIIDEIMPFNRSVGNNREQMETVAAIVHRPRGSVPFIVFGPPGTGKTVTLVEAINQLLSSDPDVRILACTPNNSAADILTEKLTHWSSMEVFRLNSLTRKFKDLPKGLRSFSLYNDNNIFAMPTLEKVLKYRVVVSTCVSAGALDGLGVKKGHFAWVFVDEAGQGKEPEVVIPIKGLADKHTNVVLAGDLMQLGPIVHSSLAKDLGLKQSYLQRLMARPCYSLDSPEYGGRGVTIMKLVKSFRSHPDILRFPNEQFYDGELQACADAALTRSLETVETLPTKRFPVMFHAVVGKDQREKSSPSFFNIDEVTIVKKYCAGLIADGRRRGIVAKDIGVITPYHAQGMKIMNLLKKDPKLEDITVGSVEQFQGQERRVIIISTVRSNKEFITSDIKRSLGFVANRQRFNVAVTRAQALLIVVGNPEVLSLDPLWRGFMNYIYTKGGWKGHRISWDPTADIYADLTAKAKSDADEELSRVRSLILRNGDSCDLLGDEEGDEIDGDLGDGLIIEDP